MALLECKNLGIQFGGLKAVDSFNLKIEKGQLYGLIGPNGAGKTTVFNLLTGVYKPTTGSIKLDGLSIGGKSPEQINSAGIARTFQNIRLFTKMTVLDNVKTALHNECKYGVLSSLTHLFSYYKKEKKMDEIALDILKVFDLDEYKDTLAGNLPYGKPCSDSVCIIWKQRTEPDGTELLKEPLCPRISGVPNHGMRRNICGNDTVCCIKQRHSRFDVESNGIYHTPCIYPV